MSSAFRHYGVLALLVLAAIAPAAWLAFRYWGTASGQVPPMQLELFKGLAQLVSVGFIGAIAAEMFRRIDAGRTTREKELQDRKQAAEEASREAHEKAERELEEQRRSAAAMLEAQAVQQTRDFEFIRGVSYDILDTYNEIKLVRRMMRAAAHDWNDTTCRIPEPAYRELCLRLESAQIGLERLKKLVRSSQDRFVVAGGTETFFDKLVRSEEYIRDILREFENHKHALDQDDRVIARKSLTYGFVAQKSELTRLNLAETAWSCFFQPMDEIEDAVAGQSAVRSAAATMSASGYVANIR
jgi:hypothetical protein